MGIGDMWRRLRCLVRRSRLDRELKEEIGFHLERLGGDRKKFGNVTRVREQSREAWGWRWLDELARDLRYGLRTLRRSPTVTAAAVLSLALGIGANTAIFSLLDAVLLRMLPVVEPERLVLFQMYHARAPGSNLSYPLYMRLRDHGQAFSGVLATGTPGRPRMRINGDPELVTSELVSGNYFTVLGVPAVLGRTLAPEDEEKRAPVAVISHRFWQRRFGSDPGVIGKTIVAGDEATTIIGVAAPEFFGIEVGQAVEVWWPLTLQQPARLANAGFNWLKAMGRLRPGTSQEQAQAAAEVVFRQFLTEAAGTRAAGWTEKEKQDYLAQRLEVQAGGTGFSRLRQQFSESLRILMAVVGLVLLIACANIANLLLARGAARRREIEIRLAIGASRARLVRQLLTESLLLAAGGGALGLLFAQWGSSLLLTFVPAGAGPPALETGPDPRVLGFTAAVSMLAGVLFGLTPALRATRTDAGPVRLRRGLVVAQVALSMVLLIGAGLLLRSLRNLRMLDPGFRRENVLTFGLWLPRGYESKRTAIYQQVLERLESLPGVQSASVSFPGPFRAGNWTGEIHVAGRTPQPAEGREAHRFAVTPRFFETLGIRLLEGRAFRREDSLGTPKVAILNQSAARFYFGSDSPLGRRFTTPPSSEPIEIVGLVQDVKHASFREAAPPIVYFPFHQTPFAGTFTVRTAASPAVLAASLRAELQAVDADLAVEGVARLAASVEEYLVQERVVATLASFFGLLALLLAAVGMYGVISYGVTRRTPEIGIRMALGAQPGDVLRLVLRESVGLVAAGAALGTVAAAPAAGLVSKLLFGLKPADPVTIAGALGLLLTVTFFAGYLPARRAARVDPSAALKYE